MIGAGSVVTKDIKKDTIIVGNPGYELKRIRLRKNKIIKKSQKKFL